MTKEALLGRFLSIGGRAAMGALARGIRGQALRAVRRPSMEVLGRVARNAPEMFRNQFRTFADEMGPVWGGIREGMGPVSADFRHLRGSLRGLGSYFPYAKGNLGQGMRANMESYLNRVFPNGIPESFATNTSRAARFARGVAGAPRTIGGHISRNRKFYKGVGAGVLASRLAGGMSSNRGAMPFRPWFIPGNSNIGR